MASVRQSGKRLKQPVTFTLEEMRAIIANIPKEPIKVMVMCSSVNALSEAGKVIAPKRLRGYLTGSVKTG
jgi:hypothetical protein